MTPFCKGLDELTDATAKNVYNRMPFISTGAEQRCWGTILYMSPI